jgi:hypothetical protein
MMLQRRGGTTRKILTLVIISMYTVCMWGGAVARLQGLGRSVGPRRVPAWAARLPASSGRAPPRSPEPPFALLSFGIFGGTQKTFLFEPLRSYPPAFKFAAVLCSRGAHGVQARVPRHQAAVGASAFERCHRSSACCNPCTCFNLHAFATPALPLTRSSHPESSVPADRARDDSVAGSLNHVLHLSARN